MLSGFRWWAPKSRGPWCTAPLAPPVWPPLLLNAVYICHFKICHAERVCVCVCPRFGTTRPIFPFSKINVALQLTKLWLKKVTTTTSLLHQFFCACYLWTWLVFLLRRSDMLRTSGFMDDVVFAHKPRRLDVAAQLRRSSHAALGLAINGA